VRQESCCQHFAPPFFAASTSFRACLDRSSLRGRCRLSSLVGSSSRRSRSTWGSAWPWRVRDAVPASLRRAALISCQGFPGALSCVALMRLYFAFRCCAGVAYDAVDFFEVRLPCATLLAHELGQCLLRHLAARERGFFSPSR
jgi:hypothetical protein